MRRQREERKIRRLRIAQDQRALSEIIEQKRRQRDGEPADADRCAAEMAHVRIKRFAAS